MSNAMQLTDENSISLAASDIAAALDINKQARLKADMIAALQAAAHAIANTGTETRRRNYTVAIEQFNIWRQSQGIEVNHSAIEQWRDSLLKSELKPNTVNAKLTAIRALLEAAAKNAREPDNKVLLRDMKAVDNIKQPNDLQAKWFTSKRYTVKEIKSMIRAIDHSSVKGAQLAALLAIGFSTGLRVAEIAALTIRDAMLSREKDIDVVLVREGKNSKSRVVPLPAWARKVVQTYLDKADITPLLEADTPLFRRLSKWGDATAKGVTPRALEYKLAEIRVEPHDMRRSFARAEIETGKTYASVQKRLGHSSVTTTERYIGRFDLTADDMPSWEA